MPRRPVCQEERFTRRLRYTGRLAKGTAYFYFYGGEAADWLDQTVKVATLQQLTLEEWIAEFERLKKLNTQIMRTGKKRSP
jgi:hypothetical protein